MATSSHDRDGVVECLRVLQVAPTYAPELGGVSTCTIEVAKRLALRGARVQVLTVDPTGRLPNEESLDGVDIRRVRGWPTDADYRFAPALMGEIARSSADVVHIQCYQTLVAPLAMIAAARSRIPYILTFHGGGHSEGWRNAIRSTQLRVLRPLLARAARLVATAEWEVSHYSELLGLGRERFVTIPNGGDLPAIPNEAEAPTRTLIASIGRAERYKGHHRVIEALPAVIAQVPDAYLWIAGTGPYEGELEALAARLGVADRVELGALADRREYAAKLSGASLATLLSEFETHPMAAIEAIALGVPMLVADNSGLAELAEKGLARAVPLEDTPASHAARMVELIHNPPEVPSALNMPSWDDCVDALVDLYRSLTPRVGSCTIRQPTPASIDA